MARPPRLVLLLGFIAWVSADPLPVLGERVNATRYKWAMAEHLTPFERKVKTVELAQLEEMCRDADGCQFTLNVSMGTLIGAISERLFLDVNEGHKWSSTPDNIVRTDGDAGGTVAGAVSESGNVQCSLADGEAPDGIDLGPGFSLMVESNNFSDIDVICTLTVMD